MRKETFFGTTKTCFFFLFFFYFPFLLHTRTHENTALFHSFSLSLSLVSKRENMFCWFQRRESIMWLWWTPRSMPAGRVRTRSGRGDIGLRCGGVDVWSGTPRAGRDAMPGEGAEMGQMARECGGKAPVRRSTLLPYSRHTAGKRGHIISYKRRNEI